MPTSDVSDGRTVESTLLDAGVLEPDDGEELHLRPAVEREVDGEFQRMANPNAERERLETVLGESVGSTDDGFEAFGATETDGGFEVRRDESVLGRWPSRTAFRTDLAVAGVLEERIDGWTECSSAERGELLSGARLFLEACPDCDGNLTFRVTDLSDERTDDSADESARGVAVLTCDDCDELLFVRDGVA